MNGNSNHILDSFLDDMVIPLFKPKPIYTIKEVSEIIKEEPHVIRYWESQFKDIIKPMRGRGNRRLYRKSDIEAILQVKHLLKVKRFTINGAKKILKLKDKRELIREEALTPGQGEKLRFLTEQVRLLIEEMERIKHNLLNFSD